MASDGNPGTIAGVSPVIGSLPPTSGKTLPQGGKNTAAPAASIPSGNILPQSSNVSAATAVAAASAGSAAPTAATAATPAGSSNPSATAANDAKSTVASPTDPQSVVTQINKYLNDSGRPDEFRVDPTSSSYIQQVNPSTGAVVAEYSVSEFPALARSVGATGLLVDDLA